MTTWSWYLSMLVCSHGLEQEAMVILEKYQEKKKNYLLILDFYPQKYKRKSTLHIFKLFNLGKEYLNK